MIARKLLVTVAAAAGISLSFSSTLTAAPASPGGILELLKSDSLVQDVRIGCFNRRTGRLIHWGYCGRRRIVRRGPPRVYCRNRRTGAFIHWGFC
jgi:hypothetical protein